MKVCIIGTGAGGGTLALELSKNSDIEVILIDTDHVENKYNHLNETHLATSSDIDLTGTTGQGLGGSSNKWHGVITKLDKSDINKINETAGIDLYADLSAYIQKLQSLFPGSHKLNKSFSSTKFDSYFNMNKFDKKKYLVYSFPLRLRKLIKTAIKKRKNLKYMGGHRCINLIANEKKKITGITCKVKNKTVNIYANIFILSCGAIENVRILSQSSISNNKLGISLMDHPFAVVGKINFPKKIIYRANGTPSIINRVSKRYGYTLKQTLPGSNHSIMFRPSLSNNSSIIRKDIRDLILGRWSKSLILRICTNRHLLNDVFILISEKFGLGYITKHLDVTVQFETIKSDPISVEITRCDDFSTFNELTVNYKLPPRFNIDIKHIQKLLTEACVPNISFTRFDLQDIEFVSGAHFSGTCFFGSKEHNSIIDTNLKYHNFDNLYICDASILPHIGNSNLFFTVSAFALRLNDHLLGILKK
jgi:hypothetical protein